MVAVLFSLHANDALFFESRCVMQIHQKGLGLFAASTTYCSHRVLLWNTKLQEHWLHSPVLQQQSRYNLVFSDISVTFSVLSCCMLYVVLLKTEGFSEMECLTLHIWNCLKISPKTGLFHVMCRSRPPPLNTETVFCRPVASGLHFTWLWTSLNTVQTVPVVATNLQSSWHT